MRTDKKQNNNKLKPGFAMLFSVLLASFLITLGISIFSISLKEIQIATSIRDSQVAYYIADSARECALYWDVKQGAFPACLDSSCSEVSTTTSSTIYCNGNPISLNFIKDSKDTSGLTYITKGPIVKNFFQASSTSISSPSADVSITKKSISNGSSITSIQTIIDSYGHNTGVVGRRVERGIEQVINQ